MTELDLFVKIFQVEVKNHHKNVVFDEIPDQRSQTLPLWDIGWHSDLRMNGNGLSWDDFQPA